MRDDTTVGMQGTVSSLKIFRIFFRLGLTSFGGPIAHLGFFRQEFVACRAWLDDKTYADLVALCQFLPGPASSQVGIALGISQAGLRGGLAAWLGFTLPSALVLALFAFGVVAFGDALDSGWLHGLKVVTVAVVAQAVWAMAKGLLSDRAHVTVAVVAAIFALATSNAVGQLLVIVGSAFVGWRFLPVSAVATSQTVRFAVNPRAAVAAWLLFFALLVLLPILAAVSGDPGLAVFDSFYRVGSLVFGGGHVVLPLLQAEVVPRGWVTNDAFLAGYGAAQAVPGPLFTFAAYLGAVMFGWFGAALCLVAIFLPSFLLVVGALPFWDKLRTSVAAQSALVGVNAGVVGLLLAALYDPVWVSAIHSTRDFALAVAALALLSVWRISPWIVVLLSAAAGALLYRLV
jgi:chromate transporter